MRPVYSKSYSVQTVNKYEIRIRHLEDTVRLLWTRKGPTQESPQLYSELRLPRKPPTLQTAGSFRYLIDRGLEPLISAETAQLLTASWRNGRPTQQDRLIHPLYHLNHSGHLDRPISARSAPRSPPIQQADSHESPLVLTTLQRSASSLDCLMDSKSRSFSFLSDATNRQAPPPDTHSLPRGEPPFSLDNRPPPLTSSPSSHSINTATPNPIQAASPAINSLADLESVHTWPTSNLTTPDPDADPNSNVFKPLSSYIDPPATTPADSGRAVDAIEQHKSHRATHSPPTVPDSTRPSLTSEITSAHASASSTPIINALSEAHCHPGDPILPDPPLLNNQYSQQPGNSSNDNLTTSSSDAVTADCSFNKEDLVQASANIITTYPHEFDVAEMGAITIRDYCDTSTDFLGSITFVEHRGTFVAPNLAPDLPHSALQHYADIDNYLNLANTDETEMKKKKNKKKKKKKAKPTSTSDNLVSDPTSSPDNPVLFYV
ncbi:hypothetical protein PSHT_04320 [Puccinia striiformis]|uniref:Uncharacterized protein n=1 Tax=Puccinia striiformis TaxID=27350 RepID=A0A2S4WD99_9BASI|nr:hypothetical protein PSHT_04320 [Puccinia striiformis]